MFNTVHLCRGENSLKICILKNIPRTENTFRNLNYDQELVMLWCYAFTKMSIEIAMIIYGTYECDAWLINSDYVCCVGYWVGGDAR